MALPASTCPVRLLAALVQVLQLLRLGKVLLEVVRGTVPERQETFRQHLDGLAEADVAVVVVVVSPGLYTLVD